MAIQMRRGNYANYDPTKIKPGEWAVALDTEQVFIGVANGAVEIAKKSDIDEASETILDAKVKALESIYGGEPSTVATVAEMTNTDLTYIYSGSETGYTAGHWYYWDGTAWTDGGQYASGMILDEISEGILESYVTEGSYTSQGVTTERISDTELKVYGTCTANRRFNVYNGFQTIRTTSSPFQAMLPAGTYRVSLSANKTTGNPRVTFSYTTYADALWTILNGQTVTYKFTQPFMFGFYANTNINYGTEDDPTIVTLRIESLTAKDEVARETKADKDGTYPDLTAGQLYTENGVENVEPYFFRAVPVAASEARMRKLVGGTVAWNQLAVLPATATQNGVTVTNNGDGSLTINGTATAETNSFPTKAAWVSGHVYYFDCMPEGARVYSQLYKGNTWKKNLDNRAKPLIRKYTYSTDADTIVGSLIFTSGTTFNNIKYYPQIFDLTLALGSTIADYIYSLETATAGAGVAFFRKYFPESYYPYNAGELKSVGGVSSHETIGFNQWDEEWELGQYRTDNGIKEGSNNHIRCKNPVTATPNTNYFFNTSGYNINVCFMDASMGFIKNFNTRHDVIQATPSNCRYIVFNMAQAYGTAYNHDICINLSGSSRNGEYEPYEKHSYPLDSSLTLRGIPKLDSNNNLYYDGDEYKADGTVTRKYGIVDLGTLTWTKINTTSQHWRFWAFLNTAKAGGGLISTKYEAINDSSQYLGAQGVATQISGADTLVMVSDEAYSDAAAFKTAMSGVYLVYELATPTTETADPFTESEIIDPYGTEEFVSTGLVPVGHDTLYVDDLKQRLEDIAPPTTDGTYTLQVTVSGGKPTFAWVAANRSLSMGNPFASAAEDEPTEETEEAEEPVKETEETEEPVEEGDMR